MRLLLTLLLAFAPTAAFAQSRLLPACTKTGDCGISDLLAVLLNVAEFLLAISGAVAFGFFVYGGILYILGGANEEYVKKAKDILRNAVIGLVIIFSSGILVRFTQSALTGNEGNVCIAENPSAPVADRTHRTPSGSTCTPVIGAFCQDNSNALWISLPAGYTNANDPSGSFIPESLECVLDCDALNSLLDGRGRQDLARYSCMNIDSPQATGCVRGLCTGGANRACCLSL